MQNPSFTSQRWCSLAKSLLSMCSCTVVNNNHWWVSHFHHFATVCDFSPLHTETKYFLINPVCPAEIRPVCCPDSRLTLEILSNFQLDKVQGPNVRMYACIPPQNWQTSTNPRSEISDYQTQPSWLHHNFICWHKRWFVLKFKTI